MLKPVAIGVASLFVAMSPLAHAQSPYMGMQEYMGMQGRFSAADLGALTDLRIDLIKNALQLTPDQTKYWPAVEEAIRSRAKNRQARLEKMIETTGARSQETTLEAIRNRDPVSFLNRRADALAQRSADLKQLASAWQPLYGTLTPEQKRRMGTLTLFVLRDMTDEIEQRRLQAEEDD